MYFSSHHSFEFLPVLYFSYLIPLKFGEFDGLGGVSSHALESSSVLSLVFLFEYLAVGDFQEIELLRRFPVVYFLAAQLAKHKNYEVRGLLAHLIVEVGQISDEFEEFAIIDLG